MKNILLITNLYPSDDVNFLNNTSVCHYFAKEWVKAGYNVRVMFNYFIYPSFYYLVMKYFKKRLAAHFGISILDKRLVEDHYYEMDGVHIYRLPIHKKKPGGRCSRKDIVAQTRKMVKILDKEGFKPDVAVGHFHFPSSVVLSELKNYYQIPTALSLHGKMERYEKVFADDLRRIDFMGYRSYPIKEHFEKMYGSEKPFFMCPSGVPSSYIIDQSKEFSEPVKDFIYVGNLVKRKYPSALVPAITQALGDATFSITYVGSGKEKGGIRKIAEQLGVDSKLKFTGRLAREDVNGELDKAQVFIMISENETFGLVYIEAMAHGCIVIASRNEGMDGYIKDGFNGFLCKAGDVNELSAVIKKIRKLSLEELNTISKNALETAKIMTDTIVAKQYIESIEK